jgi:formylglycine-generating enzyme required for sulfatase activity
MKRILILVAISFLLCPTASAGQGGGGESTKNGSSNRKEATKKKNSGTTSDNTNRPRPNATSRATVVTDIRQVDFKNFSYFIKGFPDLGFKAQTVRLSNGKNETWSADRTYRKHFVLLGVDDSDDANDVDYPRFGDLTNDGHDEAVVVVTSGGDEHYLYKQLFVYTVEGGQVKLLTMIGDERPYDPRSILDATIVGGLLVLERGDFDTFETASYRWNGDRLVQVANQPGPSAPPGPSVQVFGPGVSLDVGKNVKLELVWINPGIFQMGSPASEPNRNSDEVQHQVSIRQGFYLGKYEVTQAQWQAVMGNNPSKFKDCGGDCPVENVSWNDAQEFLRRLNARGDGHNYRLPTEAEWEYAARAGTIGAFAFGAWLSSTQANFAGNYFYGGAAKGPNLQRTAPVGRYQPNAWGLYDMNGNVSEWCEDVYTDYASTPRDGTANKSGGQTNQRVLRGGSWDALARYVRSAARRWGGTGAFTDGKGSVGFRVVRSGTN